MQQGTDGLVVLHLMAMYWTAADLHIEKEGPQNHSPGNESGGGGGGQCTLDA